MIRRAAASAAVAVVLLDVTAVGVLLPTIRVDLGSSASGGQWVMNAYLLALAAVLLAVAPGSQSIGACLRWPAGLRPRSESVVCATADSTSALVAGRAVEGAGVAILLAALALALPESRRAQAAAAALPLAAFALGPLVGGELAEHNWWHLYFWAGVPVAAILAAPALARRRPHRARPAGPRWPARSRSRRDWSR